MSLTTHPTFLWMSLLSCGFLLFSSNHFRALASPTSDYTPAVGSKLAQFNIHLPSIKLPGVPSVDGVVKGAITDQITQAVGRTVQTNAPIVSSAQAILPTVTTLPGGAFRASGDLHPIWQQIRTSSNGAVLLAPGDYAIPVNVFCMKHAASSPSGHRYLLAPLKGKLADVIVALNSRTVGLGLPHQQLQVLSWNLQAGMKYDEMTPELQSLVDQVLPDFKPRLKRSFMEQIDATWNQLSSTVPGLPSMDDSLDRLGDVGRTVVTLKQTREMLLRYGNDYKSLSRALVTHGVSTTSGETPWSRVSDRVYARMVTQGNYSTPAELQVRVVHNASAIAPIQIASSQDMISSLLADAPVSVNITNLVGDPQDAGIQPLSMSPQPPKADKENEDQHGDIWWWLHDLGLVVTRHERADLLRKGWGRPIVILDNDRNVIDVDKLSDDEIINLIAQIRGRQPSAFSGIPSVPIGWPGTPSSFGSEIEWPTRGKVVTPAENVDLAKLQRAGVTEEWATEQARIYREIAQANPRNPTAALRAEWLEKIAARLRGGP